MGNTEDHRLGIGGITVSPKGDMITQKPQIWGVLRGRLGSGLDEDSQSLTSMSPQSHSSPSSKKPFPQRPPNTSNRGSGGLKRHIPPPFWKKWSSCWRLQALKTRGNGCLQRVGELYWDTPTTLFRQRTAGGTVVTQNNPQSGTKPGRKQTQLDTFSDMDTHSHQPRS